MSPTPDPHPELPNPLTQPVSTPDWNRVGRYLAGELPPEQAEEVRRWLEENPSEAEVLRALDEATRNAAPSRPVDVEAALQAVRARRERRGPALTAFRMIAAAVVLLAAGLYASWSHQRGQAPRTFATGVGQTDTVALAGASTAILGPQSGIEIRGREIALTGDAFFTIRESGSGYVVRAGEVTVRDIGTEFGVATSGDGVRVSVAAGMVEVERRGAKVTADSGDVVEVGADIGVRQDALTADDVAWIQGRLVLRDATLREVAAQVRRWYGAELRVDSALAARRFTGSFAGESARRVAEVIALALGAGTTVSQRGDTIELRAAPNTR